MIINTFIFQIRAGICMILYIQLYIQVFTCYTITWAIVYGYFLGGGIVGTHSVHLKGQQCLHSSIDPAKSEEALGNTVKHVVS